jgi:hypothetical protein
LSFGGASTTLLVKVFIEGLKRMTWTELLVFLIFPASALIMGYVVLKLSERETARFDKERGHHPTK